MGGSIHAIIIIATTEYNGGGLIDTYRFAGNYEGVNWMPWKMFCLIRYMVHRGIPDYEVAPLE